MRRELIAEQRLPHRISSLIKMRPSPDDPERPIGPGFLCSFIHNEMEIPADLRPLSARRISYNDLSILIQSSQDDEMPAGGKVSRPHQHNDQFLLLQSCQHLVGVFRLVANNIQAPRLRYGRNQVMQCAFPLFPISVLIRPLCHLCRIHRLVC